MEKSHVNFVLNNSIKTTLKCTSKLTMVIIGYLAQNQVVTSLSSILMLFDCICARATKIPRVLNADGQGAKIISGGT